LAHRARADDDDQLQGRGCAHLNLLIGAERPVTASSNSM
jgi:hypothetical protein